MRQREGKDGAPREKPDGTVADRMELSANGVNEQRQVPPRGQGHSVVNANDGNVEWGTEGRGQYYWDR